MKSTHIRFYGVVLLQTDFNSSLTNHDANVIHTELTMTRQSHMTLDGELKEISI